ncbi:MAG: DUF2156 domain-containing protein [Bacteroidales bacterium]|nr:DUF2156 domain-containing protein [Bacteroidales bacterium]
MDSTQLVFHPVTINDKDEIQKITFSSKLRNCNFNFTNIFGWHKYFNTNVCINNDNVVIRFMFDEKPAYLVNYSNIETLCNLMPALMVDSMRLGEEMIIIGVEDNDADIIKSRFKDSVVVEKNRDRYDYIYSRSSLEELSGKELKTKRNHVNKFLSTNQDFEYLELDSTLFPKCLELVHIWQEETKMQNAGYGDTIEMEKNVIELTFNNWNSLDTIGGAILVKGRMIAFTYGAPITNDTFDICIEKADRKVEGAFNIINQQFVKHLPQQYKLINREEDMGLEGLRKAKMSYNPAMLLSFNNIRIRP